MNAKIDISSVILRTERLILRPWRWDDLDDFYAYASVDGVGQAAGWRPHETIEESRQILGHFIEQKKTFAIEYGGKVIGSLGIEEYDEAQFPEFAVQRGREIGYVLAKDFWGHGLMPEAVQAVVRYLFETVSLDFILVGHFENNRRSARVIEKCGFRYLKTTPYATQLGTTESARNYILEQKNISFRTV